MSYDETKVRALMDAVADFLASTPYEIDELGYQATFGSPG